MDKIHIRDLNIFAFHGVNPPEKENGQNFILDITLYLDLSVPCESDDVRDTVSYSDVIRKVIEAFTAEKYNLIEKAKAKKAQRLKEEAEGIVKPKPKKKYKPKPKSDVESPFVNKRYKKTASRALF